MYKQYITKNNVIIALVAIIFLIVVFNGCGDDKPLQIVKTVTHTIVQKVKADEKASIKIIDSLQERELELIGDVMEYKTSLANAEYIVNNLLDNATVVIDSSNKDQLKHQLSILKKANTAKDSICYSVINTQDSMLSVKDEIIVERILLYSKLRNSFNQVVENEGVKDANIKTLKKQLRKKKFGTVVWKVAAGAAGVFILKNSL